jgi:hypothetical protein
MANRAARSKSLDKMPKMLEKGTKKNRRRLVPQAAAG